MVQTAKQIGLPFCPAITKQMAKRHWRLVDAKRGLSKIGIESSYLSNSQLHVHSNHRYGHPSYMKGFVIQVECTDLPGIMWTIDHFKIWSVDFSHVITLFAAGNDELFKKLVHFSVLKSAEL